jgi:hypothetical protein
MRKNVDYKEYPQLNIIEYQKYINVAGIFLCFTIIVLLAVVYPSMMSVGDIGARFSVDAYNNITELKEALIELKKINRIVYKNQNIIMSFFLFFMSLPLCLCFINLFFIKKVRKLVERRNLEEI